MNPNMLIQMVLQNSKFRNNPIASNAIDMYQKNDTEGLKRLAENLCREKGINPEELLRQNGLK